MSVIPAAGKAAPWVLEARRDGPHAAYVEVGRYASKPAADRAGRELGTGYRISFAYKPVEIVEDETRNG